MDFKDLLLQLSDRIIKLKDSILTEEATKNSFILPFIQSLGYDIFNPHEVVPEFTCDVGTKKGEKIDYALLIDEQPMILIECKHWAQNLELHDNQLIRYFTVSNVRFGVLTNGIQYKFYTDLVSPNIMDTKPFLDINLTDLKDAQIDELKKFHKSYFDVDNILSAASDLKFTNELKTLLSNEVTNPSDGFVRMLAKQVYPGKLTEKVVEQFTGLIKKAFSGYINDLITDRLKSALKSESDKEQQAVQKQEPITQQAQPIEVPKILTTDEEKEAFIIIKSILRFTVDIKRITHRDVQTYCSVLFDDNNRKPICRLYFNRLENKIIAIPDENKKDVKYPIEQMDDIYTLSDPLIKSVSRYL